MSKVQDLHHAKDQSESDRNERENAAEQKAADDGLPKNDGIHEDAPAGTIALLQKDAVHRVDAPRILGVIALTSSEPDRPPRQRQLPAARQSQTGPSALATSQAVPPGFGPTRRT